MQILENPGEISKENCGTDRQFKIVFGNGQLQSMIKKFFSC